ncbi:MAG: divergent PAP2 family protein [Spirochaetales bacterium]|nr:divergent PAP2 family protein [Spirochaetales bacterium]
MDYLKAFISNRVILCAFFSWFFAQFLKMIIELTRKRRLKRRDFIMRTLFGTGGMPSSHSASVASVAVAIGIECGFDSPIFALAFLQVFLVVRDATGVRLSSGLQASAINDILRRINANKDNPDQKSIKPVKEVNGHTPVQCFVGLVVGIFVALCVYFI